MKLVEKLWREDPEVVRALYNSIAGNHASESYRLRGYYRRSVESPNRTLNARKKFGLTLTTIAKRKRIKVATLASLLEHHGLLELVQYGLDQKRRMVTQQACDVGLGHNVNPVNRIGHLEGHGKSSPFPVFYEERLSDIMWMLDVVGIRRKVMKLDGKKSKLSWLLQNHPYLPDEEIATLTGYHRNAARVARRRFAQQPPSATLNAA